MSMDTQLVELCQALIRRPSVSGEEKGVAEFLKGTMEQLGYDQVEIDRYGSELGRIHGIFITCLWRTPASGSTPPLPQRLRTGGSMAGGLRI